MIRNYSDRNTRERSAPAGMALFPVSVFRFQPSQRASSLVTTLLVLVVLSTIVVAFMQSMSVERNVARSAKNILQARLLVDAASDEALQRLLTTTTNGPLSALWDRDASGNPYLFLGKRVLRGTGIVTTRLPLFSSAAGNVSYFENLSAAQITNLLTVPDLDNNGNPVTRSLNSESEVVAKMNLPFPSQTNGMVGLMNGTTPLPLPVNWTYVRDTNGRVVGRYAFWIDDECSKIDLRFAGQTANAGGTHTRSNGTNLSDLSLLVFTNSPVGATTADISNLLALKTFTNGFTNPAFVQYPLTASNLGISSATWQKMRPYLTTYSLHDDRSPDGKRRLNLNEVVSSTNTASQIEKETFAIRDAITNNLPSFGLRYYSADGGASVAPTLPDQSAYATKIAANIRDSVDTNNIATIIKSDGTACATNSPDFIPYNTLDSDLPVTFGKEGGPFLSEYFRIVRVIAPDPHPGTDADKPVAVTVRFAHYVELHNPTGRTITYADLGPDPFVLLSHRTSWNNTVSFGSPSVLRLADIKIHLPSTFSIPAGGFAVLTTDGPPWRDSQTNFIGSASNRYEITGGTGPGQWELVNADGKASTNGSNFEDYEMTTAAVSVSGNQNYAVQNAAPASPTYSDQSERLLLGNDNGLIDYSLKIYTNQGLYLARGNRNPNWISTFIADSETFSRNTPNNSDTEPRFTRGDVRSNTEISRISFNNSSACWKQGSSGAYGDTLSSAPQQTLGATNFNTTQSTQTGVQRWRQWWHEYTSDLAGNHFVASRPMASLGELGSIYDPVRYDINGFRSQGATLRIGQSDSATNNRANSTNADYKNWLGGRGADDVTSTNYTKNAFLLMDVFRTDAISAGRVNPNSIVRDPAGLVFRSVLDQFVFESSATNQASLALSGAKLNVTNTLSSFQSFATNPANGYFVSVGDLSRSPLFHSSTNALAGVSMLGTSDAGREEFMRRSANLLTTQSLAFTIFIRAQAGNFEGGASGVDRFNIKAGASREMTVQIQPVYPAGGDPLVPVAPTGWNILRPHTINY